MKDSKLRMGFIKKKYFGVTGDVVTSFMVGREV